MAETDSAGLNVITAKREQMFKRVQTLYDLSKTITAEKDRLKINNFKVRYLQLEETYIQYQELTERINLLSMKLDPTKFKPDFQSITVFEELYYKIKAVYMQHFSDKLAGSDSSQSEKPAQPRLPKIELGNFDGALKNWTIFYDKFKSLIHDNVSITPIEKFHYLLSSVSGPALSIVKSLPLTSQNYEIVWDSLVAKYQNKRILGGELLDSILSYKTLVKESIANYNDYLATFKDSVVSLKALNVDDLSEFILTYLALRGLPLSVRKQFEMHIAPTHIPTFDEVMDFVQKQVNALEISKSVNPYHFMNDSSSSDKSSVQKIAGRPKRAFTASSSPSNYKSCIICSDAKHSVYNCPTYDKMTPVQRKTKIRELKCCFNCLKKHMLDTCPSKVTCSFCNLKHHSTLHIPYGGSSGSKPHSHNSLSSVPRPFAPDQSSTTKISEGAGNLTATTGLLNSSGSEKTVLLGTAIVHIRDFQGHYLPVRALIDSGAQTSFITTACVQRLGLKVHKCDLPIAGLGQSFISNIKGMTSCTLKPRHSDNPLLKTNAVILSKITSTMPTVPIPDDIHQNFKHLILADPHYDKPSSIDFLIAADIFPFLYDGQKIQGGNGFPSALHSIFGWVITGEVNCINSLPVVVHLSTFDSPLDDILKRFWECEEPPKLASSLNPDDQKCEELFQRSVTRTVKGRYVVPLPFRESISLLPCDNYFHAHSRLMSTERRLVKNPDLAVSYNEFLREYEHLGHMTRVPDADSKLSGYFIPHHAVMKASSSTTKLRVVFDGSSQPPNGPSLNSLLLAGPKLQQDISVIICHFRLHNYVFTADISKMYRQILVRQSDRIFQRILWRPDINGCVETFELNTVTYGLKPSPYLALRTLKQLSKDEGEQYPAAAAVLERDIYIDDLLTGTSTIQAAKNLKRDLIHLLSLGGFELRKWSSNCKEIIEDIPTEHLETPLSFDHDGNGVIKVLGLQWNSKADTFSYQICPSDSVCSKRSILSHVARVYDPLGWLSPVIFRSKCLIQRLWHLGIDWDDPVPDYINTEWTLYCKQLPLLSQVQIPRRLLPSDVVSTYLVGFSDASERGYSAVVYLVSYGQCSNLSNLVLAKSKVAPLKTLSIPRLELCGALLLSHLLKHLISILSQELSITGTFAFTDSTTVLTWLKTSPHLLKTYVATRVSQILDSLPPTSWNHVSTDFNPADCSSRGLDSSQLLNHPLWWHGPSWLSKPISDWPICCSFSEPTDIPELKCPSAIHSFHSTSMVTWPLIEKLSSFTKLLRFTAWFLRYKKYLLTSNDLKNSCKGPLTLGELDQSLYFLVKTVQQETFLKDLSLLAKGQPCHPSLQRLNPFIDDVGVLRVGGRLKHSFLPQCSIHPIILPKSCHFTNILIDYYHLRYLHVGPRTLQSIIARHFWILCARKVIRSRLSKCLICFKAKAAPQYPLMGDLPQSRVTPSKPFFHTGVDYGGPFLMKESKRKNARIYKCYLCLFVCFSTKAVHLEVVSDLSSEAFLAALDRFVARRGLCRHVYSDCGTNFVGANRQLKELYDVIRSSNTLITNKLSDLRIVWHFNPPSAPHMGGIWEAGIRAVKHHLQRVLPDRALTFEEYSTLFAKIELILNSRPLCDNSTDPSEVDALTPYHFLTGSAPGAPIEQQLEDINTNHLNRWQLIRQTSQHFWQRWSRDYLHTLQQRSKWLTSKPNLKIGDLVLLVEKTPPLQWHMGKVEDIHPGSDDVVRVVTVKTTQGTYRRPVAKLCPLPFN